MDAGLPQYERSPMARSSTSSASRGARAPTEHLYHLTASKSPPWLTLKVTSKAPASSYLPAFYQGEAITGSVVLCLDKEEPIKSISVQVSRNTRVVTLPSAFIYVDMHAGGQLFGQMTSSATDVLSFLQLSQVLWPQPSALHTGAQSTANAGKLSGEHSWPFTLTLPESCLLKSPSGLDQSYSLPASFSERMARVHIQYQIVVTVHRSRFRVDST